jgi:hypothetical protein
MNGIPVCAFYKFENACNVPSYYFKNNSKVFYVCSSHISLLNSSETKPTTFQILKTSDFLPEFIHKAKLKLLQVKDLKKIYTDFAQTMINEVNLFCKSYLESLNWVQKNIYHYKSLLLSHEFIEDFKIKPFYQIGNLDTEAIEYDKIKEEFVKTVNSLVFNKFPLDPDNCFKRIKKIHLEIVEGEQIHIRNSRNIEKDQFISTQTYLNQLRIIRTKFEKIRIDQFSKPGTPKLEKNSIKSLLSHKNSIKSPVSNEKSSKNTNSTIFDFKKPRLMSIKDINIGVESIKDYIPKMENLNIIESPNKRNEASFFEDTDRKNRSFNTVRNTEMNVWVCRCSNSNANDWDACTRCYRIKPGVAGWTCSQCKYINRSDETEECEVCCNPRICSKPVEEGTWECNKCDAVNPEQQTTCYKCSRSRFNHTRANSSNPERITKETEFQQKDTSFSNLKNWKCGYCYKNNSGTKGKCLYCKKSNRSIFKPKETVKIDQYLESREYCMNFYPSQSYKFKNQEKIFSNHNRSMHENKEFGTYEAIYDSINSPYSDKDNLETLCILCDRQFFIETVRDCSECNIFRGSSEYCRYCRKPFKTVDICQSCSQKPDYMDATPISKKKLKDSGVKVKVCNDCEHPNRITNIKCENCDNYLPRAIN